MIGAIENAIIARLKAASDSNVLGYTLRTIESYGGQFADEERLNKLIRYPAAYVVFLGDRPLGETGYSDQLGATFAVIVAAQNVRNEASTRHGDGGEVGTYQLIKDVRGLLKRQDFGLDIGGFALGPARSLFSGTVETRRVSVFAVEFSTTYSDVEDIDAVASGLDDFKTFHVNWDVPPIGNVAADNQLPDDANSDATDHQTLNSGA
ncbi:MAG: phage protein Gp37 [Parvibaculum sedimenti]|uniref:DUF1834 family protein n=1 Tax=Parvibaculum sedimenti TaxID=2608632 RepID=UPI003BB6A732